LHGISVNVILRNIVFSEYVLLLLLLRGIVRIPSSRTLIAAWRSNFREQLFLRIKIQNQIRWHPSSPFRETQFAVSFSTVAISNGLSIMKQFFPWQRAAF